MFGLNWIDVVIVILLALAVYASIKIGLLTQVFIVAGFLGALFVGGWLFPYLLPIHDRTLRTLINANLVLIAAIYTAMRGYDFAQKIHWSFPGSKLSRNKFLQQTETWLGFLPGVIGSLLTIWLLAVMVCRLPFAGLSNSVNDARIVQTLTQVLPPVPAVFAEFNRQIDPNAEPYVFAQSKPQASFDYSVASVELAATKAAPSVVRLTSFSCGGLISGSGFIVAPNLVATNAHVIAGATRPIIKYNNTSYEGVPVLFDPGIDFAVIRIQNLGGWPLALARENIAIDTSVAVLGYPGGNYTVSPGLIRDNASVFGRNIYDLGRIGRNIYAVQTNVNPGSSGGPVVLPDGRVAGIIFSKSNTSSDYGYALASSYLTGELSKAQKSYRRVSTGACIAN
ncbi:MAG: MarP family serine protease [Candidatus Saccharibacteria bacterium]